jgi:putative transposase
MAGLFVDTLQSYRKQGNYLLHEFVIMPNHAHLLVSPCTGITLEVQFIKGGFSYRAWKELGFGGEVWSRGYVDHRIRDSQDYTCHREYIYSNPIRARLCDTPASYAYSSANPSFSIDPVPQGLKPIAVHPHGTTKVVPSLCTLNVPSSSFLLST